MVCRTLAFYSHVEVDVRRARRGGRLRPRRCRPLANGPRGRRSLVDAAGRRSAARSASCVPARNAGSKACPHVGQPVARCRSGPPSAPRRSSRRGRARRSPVGGHEGRLPGRQLGATRAPGRGPDQRLEVGLAALRVGERRPRSRGRGRATTPRARRRVGAGGWDAGRGTGSAPDRPGRRKSSTRKTWKPGRRRCERHALVVPEARWPRRPGRRAGRATALKPIVIVFTLGGSPPAPATIERSTAVSLGTPVTPDRAALELARVMDRRGGDHGGQRPLRRSAMIPTMFCVGARGRGPDRGCRGSRSSLGRWSAA